MNGPVRVMATRAIPSSVRPTMRDPDVARTCRICGSAGSGVLYLAREMLTGSRDEFGYFECPRCGCLQIGDIPHDLGKYYPKDYYSLSDRQPDKESWGLRSFLRKKRDSYLLFRKEIGGKLLQALRPAGLPFELLGRVPGIRNLSILDVGCGRGMFLRRLHALGVHQVMGIDPFIGNTIEYENGLTVFKGTIQELAGEKSSRRFDVILFNHSFEHIPDLHTALQAAASLLKAGGQVIMHIPLADSHAWKYYGTAWVQLDAPRHLYLLSHEALRILSNRAGFVIDDVHYTSTAFQFWGSELYVRDIAMSQYGFPEACFSRSEMKHFAAEARVLNETKQGDQAAFYLRIR